MDAQQRSDRARLAARARWAKVADSRAETQRLRDSNPTSIAYWLIKVDPDGTLDPVEREDRASVARSEYQRRLAHRSAVARAERRGKV